jgi:hypothetical protein
MRTEVEVVASLVPCERGSIGAREHDRPVGIDPRDAYVVAYYLDKFREVGHGWSSGD